MPPIRILFVVCAIDVLGFGMVIPLVPYMGTRFGVRPELITAVLGSYSLCQFLSAPLWGRLSDRYGRRPILMSSLAGACLSYGLLAIANNLWLLFASRILAGLMAGNLAAAFAYASDVSAPEQRARSMGMVGAAIGIGFMLGMPIGGALAGESAVTANFTRPALVSAALSILAICLVRWALPETRDLRAVVAAPRRGPRPLRLLAERPALRSVSSAAFLITCSQGVLESIFAIWALARFGFGPRTVGLALFGIALLMVLMQGRWVRVLAPRFGESRLGAAGGLAYTAGLGMVACAGHNEFLVAAGLALCGLGMGAFNPSASSLASRQSLPDDRGAVMGTYQASTSLARAVGPFVSGPIYAALGANAPFIAGALIALPAAWLLWRLRGLTTPSEFRRSTLPDR
ncbi:MAG TPA: MFS transporter [Steroidobacteraceae bacterium]|nr:MFS transporter [Steroidobacteraceae bacterium]